MSVDRGEDVLSGARGERSASAAATTKAIAAAPAPRGQDVPTHQQPAQMRAPRAPELSSDARRGRRWSARRRGCWRRRSGRRRYRRPRRRYRRRISPTCAASPARTPSCAAVVEDAGSGCATVLVGEEEEGERLEHADTGEKLAEDAPASSPCRRRRRAWRSGQRRQRADDPASGPGGPRGRAARSTRRWPRPIVGQAHAEGGERAFVVSRQRRAPLVVRDLIEVVEACGECVGDGEGRRPPSARARREPRRAPVLALAPAMVDERVFEKSRVTARSIGAVA